MACMEWMNEMNWNDMECNELMKWMNACMNDTIESNKQLNLMIPGSKHIHLKAAADRFMGQEA